MKSTPDMSKLIQESLGNADGQEADAFLKELEEWQIWGSMSGGSVAGFFPALFAIDALDDVVDGSDLDPNVKAALKWTERGVDLTLGILGTAMNGYRISKKDAKWYHYFLSAASVTQIPVSIYKMAELGGLIGGEGGTADTKKKGIANLKNELEAKMTALENRVSGSTVEEEERYPEGAYPAGG